MTTTEGTLTETTNRSAKGKYEPIGAAELTDHDGRSMRFRCGSTTVETTVLAPDLFRVGAFPNGQTPDYGSEAIYKDEWLAVEASMERTDSGFILSTREVKAEINTNPLRISFSDPSGRTFAADDMELGMGFFRTPGSDIFTKPLGDAVRLHKRREEGERSFGCGERTGGLDKTGTSQTFWNVDPPSGHTDAFDNIYSSIPFTLSATNGKFHGLLFDNTHRVEFDLGKKDGDLSAYEARGGDLVYYVFAGPTPKRVLERYTELTGRTPMPPMWSLGNQQCRWSYETAEEVREIARNFRERGIPCDVVYLDIDYMDGYRVFTWNDEGFPEPEKLIAELGEDGFRVAAIVDPGVKADEDYFMYSEGRERGFFCRTMDGEEYNNAVWPGVCAFPDFTSSEARKWWGGNHKILLDAGVSGIWCDMNEPALFIPKGATMPDDAVHPGDGEAKLHAQIHNTYGSLMAKATREGLLELRPDERPFVITRAGYAGMQRHAMQWTGDNSSWWEHLWMAMPQLQNLGLSGVAWAGVDIGGFFDDGNGELLARFTEFGVFQPFCRNHSAKGTASQEPWAFGEPYESVCRAMIKLRMRLLPYFYTLFEESHRNGSPILRPLLFEYPEDETTYALDDEFLLGDALLVAPITRPGIEHRSVYLPEGTWFHYWTDEKFEGGRHILVHAPLGQPAMYMKANKALPMGPEKMHTGEKMDAPLAFLIYPSEGSGEAGFYEDAGDGFGYESGEYARRKVSCEATGDAVTVRLGGREGSFEPERSETRIELRGIEREPGKVSVDGGEASFEYGGNRLVITFAERVDGTVIEVGV